MTERRCERASASGIRNGDHGDRSASKPSPLPTRLACLKVKTPACPVGTDGDHLAPIGRPADVEDRALMLVLGLRLGLPLLGRLVESDRIVPRGEGKNVGCWRKRECRDGVGRRGDELRVGLAREDESHGSGGGSRGTGKKARRKGRRSRRKDGTRR